MIVSLLKTMVLVLLLSGASLMVLDGVMGTLTFGKLLSGVSCSFVVDLYAVMFMVVSSYVVLSILWFGSWYMSEEPGGVKFTLYLVFFFFFMLTLVFGGNLISLMVGWEGVSIMSFLLIAWWSGREEASQAAVQAIIYNRVGDFGLYMGIFLILQMGSTWDLGEGKEIVQSLSFFLLFGALAKSSQFFFHPWLPNAMESPTPVSSLLHSSTMVVAGVFLLIRLGNIVGGGCELFFGALTMLYGSLCALSQADMKKIIAFSTTSQLGLMVCCISMSFYGLAFFHLCMHAFFKSLIFISSSLFIHSQVGGLQDTRKGGVKASFAFCCLVLGSLSLSGSPFMAGFFSKDLILENMHGPVLNRLSTLIMIIASVATVAYSVKLSLAVGSGEVLPAALKAGVEGGSTVFFMFRPLFLGVVGGSLSVWFFGVGAEEFLPGWYKVIPLMIIAVGCLVSLSMGVASLSSSNLSTFMYSYNPLFHRVVVGSVLTLVSRGVGAFEYFWWEVVYGGLASALIRTAAPASQILLGQGLRAYFLYFALATTIGALVMSF